MGLIKAALGAAGGVLADQWKEFFLCDSIPNDTLMVKGQKQVGSRSSNTKGSDNVITNGSGIQVSPGQCMIIVEQGVIVEVCAEEGVFTYDNTLAPTIFTGGLGEGIINSFKEFGKRFTMGGSTGVDQRVYYINTKEILDNKFGTPTPIPFRIVDSRTNIDFDVDLKCSGTYSYFITDPILFFRTLAGNVSSEYTRDEIDGQLKTEFINSLAVGMSRISALEIRPSAIPAHQDELCGFMNEALIDKWGERGITVKNIALNPINLSDEDKDAIRKVQQRAVNADPTMANAALNTAMANALEGAANNESGAMAGFMGMGMAMNQMGGGMAGMMQANQQAAMQQAATAAAPSGGSAPASAEAKDAWKCSCGATATGKFCPECGSPRPVISPDKGWSCSCGVVNQGKFCTECGSPKPAGALQYKCDKCGWTPEDPANPPKFCPECGDPFGDEDLI